MSKSSIKAVIDAAIKQNGTKSITGPVLNSVLNQMVDEVPDVVNDKTTGGTGKAWSAEQGKDLSADVSQLAQEVDEINAEKVVLSENDLRNYSIKIDGTYGTSTNYKHILVDVKPGEKYLIEATGAQGARYAFFSEIDSPVAGGSQPLVSGTSDVDITSGSAVVVTIPSGCVALALYFGQSPYPYKPDLYRKIDVPQMEQDIEDINEEIAGIKTGTEKNYESGKYLSVVNGVLKEIADEAWGITDFVPYTYDNPVSWRYADTGSAAGKNIAFYDSNKVYINNAYWGGTSTGVRNISSSDIQTYAQGAAYIRASFKIGDGCYIKENGVTIWQPQEDSLGLQLLQDEITEIDGNVAAIDTRVTALESGSDGSAGSLNKFKESAIVSIAAKIGTQVPKVKDNFLCFLHISDIHGDAERMKRAIAFANSQNNIAAILATGDFSQSEWTSDGFEKCFTELYQTANIPMLPVIGNHDVGLKKKIYNPANSNQAVGARFISPFMTALGCVQGGTDAGYYYKDFSLFKVRLIVVNEYEMPRVPNAGNTELKYSIWGRYFSQEQADWLVSTLNSVQSGWSVIIATHQLIDVFSKYDNEFKGAVNYSNADVELAQVGMMQDIVDAYIAKGTLTKTYSVSGADTTEVPDVSVDADFTGANGDFICYINGHTHNDGTGQSSYAQAKQVNINVTTGSANVSNQAVYDDLYRDNDTIAQDAFNLVAFDTINKKIRMLRIGANVTMDMKRRDYALIPYSQS